MSDWPNESKLSARHIKMGCEASLRRLGVDHIDLYQMHHIDRETPWAEIWQAMEQLVQEGKIIYVGSSNFAGWNIAQATEIAKHRNFLGLVSEQSLYNLTARTLELEVIPACLALGMGVIPWSPLSGGFLAGALRNHAEGRRSHMIDRIEQNRSKLEAYESLCDEIGAGPAECRAGMASCESGGDCPDHRASNTGSVGQHTESARCTAVAGDHAAPGRDIPRTRR